MRYLAARRLFEKYFTRLQTTENSNFWEKIMTNNQNTNSLDETTATAQQRKMSEKVLKLPIRGQNIGGGKDERTIDVGETSDGKEFSKTDQSITQAAPGQTVTNTTQGGSNI
jgi:hypothetical protein